eukprot:g1801.t1
MTMGIVELDAEGKSTYEGEYEDQMFHGTGVWSRNFGDKVYRGTFSYGKPDGHGELTTFRRMGIPDRASTTRGDSRSLNRRQTIASHPRLPSLVTDGSWSFHTAGSLDTERSIETAATASSSVRPRTTANKESRGLHRILHRRPQTSPLRASVSSPLDTIAHASATSAAAAACLAARFTSPSHASSSSSSSSFSSDLEKDTFGKFAEHYKGSFKNGHFHGFGCLRSEGSQYTGMWVNGKMEGEGTLVRPGWRYEGQFKANMRHGFGSLVCTDGTTFMGTFHNDLFSSYGEMVYADGSRYYGEWKEGRYHGYGFRTLANGTFYRGSFEMGQRHGHGFWKGMNGRSSEGVWRHGKRVGSGIFTLQRQAVDTRCMKKLPPQRQQQNRRPQVQQRPDTSGSTASRSVSQGFQLSY